MLQNEMTGSFLQVGAQLMEQSVVPFPEGLPYASSLQLLSCLI